ncbi:MAG: hypothetical protein ACQESC_02955 [Nanobdellota archaeon]
MFNKETIEKFIEKYDHLTACSNTGDVEFNNHLPVIIYQKETNSNFGISELKEYASHVLDIDKTPFTTNAVIETYIKTAQHNQQPLVILPNHIRAEDLTIQRPYFLIKQHYF